MKTIRFFAGHNRSHDLLHIETDGGIVNIRTGLHFIDHEGIDHQRTSIEILRDESAWTLDGFINNNLIKVRDDKFIKVGKEILP